MAPLDPNYVFTVSLRVRRRTEAPPLPDLAAIPHGLIARDEFANKYSASPSDLDAVAQFATANELKVIESSIARRTVVLKGKAAQMSKAFGVALATYKTAEGTYRGREGDVRIPTELVNIVEGVFGLDNRKMPQRE